MNIINELNFIKSKLLSGFITYDEAKKESMPFIKEFNDLSKEKALKYGVKPRLLNFSSFMR